MYQQQQRYHFLLLGWGQKVTIMNRKLFRFHPFIAYTHPWSNFISQVLLLQIFFIIQSRNLKELAIGANISVTAAAELCLRFSVCACVCLPISWCCFRMWVLLLLLGLRESDWTSTWSGAPIGTEQFAEVVINFWPAWLSARLWFLLSSTSLRLSRLYIWNLWSRHLLIDCGLGQV